MNLELIKNRLSELNIKEKIGVTLALIVIIYALWDFAIHQPTLKKEALLSSTLEEKKKAITSLKKQVKQLVSGDKTMEYRQNRKRIKSIKKQIEQTEVELREITTSLISPEQMAKVLETLLVESEGLTIRKLQGLGAKPYPEQAQTDQVDGDTSIIHEQLGNNIKSAWQHGLQIEFSGSYLDTMDYLKSLEDLDWKFYWDSVELQVDEYPKVNTAIKVYTLSLDEGWIGV